MAVPTLAEFEHLRSLLAASDRPVLTADASVLASSFKKSGTLDAAMVAAFLQRRIDIREDEWSAACSTAAMRWLHGQQAFHEAMKSARWRHKKTDSIPPQLEADRIIARIAPPAWEEFKEKLPLRWRSDDESTIRKRYESRVSIDGQLDRLSGHLAEQPLWSLGARIVKAIQNYHYAYRDQIEAVRKLTEMLDKASKLFFNAANTAESIEALCNDLRIYAPTGHRFIAMKAARLAAIKPQLTDKFPIARNDKTARERLLVVELAEAFWRSYQSYKPSAVWHLLAREGVETQLDLRLVEVIIKEHKERRSRRLEG